MAKILKVKIEVTHVNNATQYVGYPKEWMDNKSKISSILYPQDRTDEVVENGKIYHIVYPVLPDDVYELMKNLPICSEPDLSELSRYADKHAPQITRISDQEKVLQILSKAALEEKLTKEEKDALNPDNPTPGIIKSKKWIDTLQDYGVTNV
jgi:hypothetical protein